MIHAGRIPLTADEHAAVEKLLAKHAGENLTLTRRDAGETGPVLVHADAKSYLVDGAKTRTVR